jgi:hypothetical protein
MLITVLARIATTSGDCVRVGLREVEIADHDGRLIAQAGCDRRTPSADGRAVDDVVMDQRRGMGQLDCHRGGHQPDRVEATAPSGQQHECWANALAACLEQVGHGLADVRRVLLYLLSEIGLDNREICARRSKEV